MTTTVPAPVPLPLIETILRMSPLDVLLFDTELICRYASFADGTLFGRAAADFIGQPADEIFPPARGDLRSALQLAAGSDGHYEYPAYRYTYADTRAETETAFCWSVRVEPVILHDYRGREEFHGVLVTLADVLDMTDENDRLRQENDELQREVDRLRQELTAIEQGAALAPSRRPRTNADGTPAGGNWLLAALPVEEHDRLLPDLERVHLAAQDVLYEPGAPIAHVYFPIDSVTSLVTVMADGSAAEAATVGNDGIVGIDLFLGVDRPLGRAFCQVPGDTLRMPAAAFREAITHGGALRWLLRHYARALLNQVEQTAACNRLHRVDRRGARWLLQVHDHIGADEFPLKQEFLALMLGVQRPTVSQVAGALRQAGAITYSRGRLRIVDRRALEAAACECYAVIRGQFEQMLA